MLIKKKPLKPEDQKLTFAKMGAKPADKEDAADAKKPGDKKEDKKAKTKKNNKWAKKAALALTKG